MFSLQNQIKTALLGEMTTDKKIEVPWEINGWLETNQKQRGVRSIIAKRKSMVDVVKSLEYTENVPEKNLKERSSAEILPPKPSTCYRTRFRYNKQGKQNKISEEQKKEENVIATKIDMSAVDCNNSVIYKSRRNSKGYVLNEMRRRRMQKTHVRLYSSVSMNISEKQNICTMNTKDSIDYLHKQFRVVSITNRNCTEKQPRR